LDGFGHFQSIIILSGSPSELLRLALVIFIKTDDLVNEILAGLYFLAQQRSFLEVAKIKDLILEP
jgi:hypothetical protein